MSVYKIEAERGRWRIVRHPSSGKLYVSWYDQNARQTRRASLRTDDLFAAANLLQALEDSRLEDPRDFFSAKRVSTVSEVLENHRSYIAQIPSAGIEEISIRKIVATSVANRRLASLRRSDFDGLRDGWLREGTSIATVSRRLSTLRSAIRRAKQDKLLPAELVVHVPEYRTKNHIRASDPKGRICSTEELARLYANAIPPHLRLALFLAFATGARIGSLLELTTAQFDCENSLVDLNPGGRVQNGKYRPKLPMIDQLASWCVDLRRIGSGHLVSWRGKEVQNLKSAMRNARSAAGLPASVNFYSIRHSLARFMRKQGVATEEIAVWLGHIAPPQNPETTLLYSPFLPGYLTNAKRATSAFVDEIASRAGLCLADVPDDIRAYVASERSIITKESFEK